MNISQLIVLQLIAHLLSDFTFQPEKKSEDKHKFGFKSRFLKWHFFLTFFLSWLLSFQINFFFASLAIALTHWFVDRFNKHFANHGKTGKYVFFLDQTIHLIFILSIVLFFNNYYEIKPLINVAISIKHLLIISGFIICTKPANLFIKEVINAFEIKVSNADNVNNDLPNAGKLIGIIERFLVLAFILVNQFEAIGFLLAAKSILRFKDDNTIKTEYVLVGTMLSFGIAIALGLIINLL